MPETVVQCKPRPRNRVLIELSGGRFFTIPDSEARGFKTGTKLHAEDIQRLARIDQYLRGKEKVLRLLSLRSRTKREIKTALEKLGLEKGVVKGILEELLELGLIDDLRFAREYVRAKTELRGLGPQRLDFELKRLGVSRPIIDKVLGEAFSNESQEEMAWHIIKGKLAEGRLDEKRIKRISDLLKRRGFDFEIVNNVTFELLERSHSQRESERK